MTNLIPRGTDVRSDRDPTRTAPAAEGSPPLPRVVLHSVISVDGRIIDGELEDPIAARLPHDAVVVSAPTVLAAADAEGHDMSIEDPAGTPPPRSEPHGRPWLVVVDPHGLVRRWNWLRTQPYWRDVVVIVTKTTSTEHLDRLRKHGVRFLFAGPENIDTEALLSLLATDLGVTHARVSSHMNLSAALLQANLIDELSLVVTARLAGGSSPLRFNPMEAAAVRRPVELALTHVEPLSGGAVWLRYRVLSKRAEYHPAEVGTSYPAAPAFTSPRSE